MCSKKHCPILYFLSSVILPLRSEWVEVSVQKKYHFSTTDRSPVLATPNYSNYSFSKRFSAKDYAEIFLSSTTYSANSRLLTSFTERPTEVSAKQENVIERRKKNRTTRRKLRVTTTSTERTRTTEKTSTKSSSNESPSSFSSFLHHIQEELLKKPHEKLKNKVEILVNLRDKLIAQLQERVTEYWPENRNSKAREYKDDHNIDFPSNEGALVTIAFLTFAVFIIKLVLKLIHVLKNKNSQYYSYIPATMVTMSGKKKRSIQEGMEDGEFLKVMEAIQKLPSNHVFN